VSKLPSYAFNHRNIQLQNVAVISSTTPAVGAFKMAYQCLQCAEVVRNSASIFDVPSNKPTTKSSKAKSPPPIPPKPKRLTQTEITQPSKGTSNTKGLKGFQDIQHDLSKRHRLPHLQLTNSQDFPSDTVKTISPRPKLPARPSTVFRNINSKNVAMEVPQLAVPSPLSQGKPFWTVSRRTMLVAHIATNDRISCIFKT
jgi:hypothetical protein